MIKKTATAPFQPGVIDFSEAGFVRKQIKKIIWGVIIISVSFILF